MGQRRLHDHPLFEAGKKYQDTAKVISTLTGHKGRVNSVQWIPASKHGPETEIISASTDKTAIVWSQEKNQFKAASVLVGHTEAVTMATGLYLTTDEPLRPKRTLIATASVDSTVRVWERHEENFSCFQTLSFGTGFALDLSWVILPSTKVPVLAVGMDDQKIHLYVEQEKKFVTAHRLVGHEDWIRGVEFSIDDSGDILLASCGQDFYIRIWRISLRDLDTVNETKIKPSDLDLEADIKLKEDTFTVECENCVKCFAVTLESVLQGHENWIYSIHWQPPVIENGKQHQPLCLLSASMDKTLILWAPDPESGVWIEQVRVGEVGGNNLGFYGGVFGPDGQSVLAHGYQGAFHLWKKQEDKNSWQSEVTCGGHFDAVHDLCWDPKGEFLISTGQDQTTRLHAFWHSKDPQQSAWHEIVRPQIHGYDLQCVCMVHRFCFASGADEKVIRIFEAPRNFLENFASLCKVDVSEALKIKELSAVPEGASVPALGLSNKAVYQGEVGSSSHDPLHPHPTDQYPEVYFSPVHMTKPPTEENLLQNTLWPETQKLYGHGYEIFALACHPKGTVLASACKAAKAEHAAVHLWDTATWQGLCQLESHSLTVTQMAFSHSGNFLLSVSRDRTWALFQERNANQAEGPLYRRVAFTDKKTSVHSRIIWSCAWSHDDKYFITVSRDKKAIVWRVSNAADGGSQVVCVPGAPLGLNEAITAVDCAPTLHHNSYILAFGLESGQIHIYRWTDKNPKSIDSWSQILVLEQREAHHMTVKRLQFRPILHDQDTSELYLASCGLDHMVKIHSLKLLQ